MTGPVRPALRLAVGEPDQVPRLAAFRAAHPDVIVEAGEFGTWQARIPEENGETIITRHRLGELLDKLKSLGAADEKIEHPALRGLPDQLGEILPAERPAPSSSGSLQESALKEP